MAVATKTGVAAEGAAAYCKAVVAAGMAAWPLPPATAAVVAFAAAAACTAPFDTAFAAPSPAAVLVSGKLLQ